MKKILTVIFVFFSLSSCATTRPYSGWVGYGYIDTPGASPYESTFLITYRAEGLLNFRHVEPGVRARAEAVCKEKTAYDDQWIYYYPPQESDGYSQGTYNIYIPSKVSWSAGTVLSFPLGMPTKIMSAVVVCIRSNRGDPGFEVSQRVKKDPPSGLEVTRSSLANVDVGDLVTAIDGRLLSEYVDFVIATRDKMPGETSKLIVWRGNDRSILEITYR